MISKCIAVIAKFSNGAPQTINHYIILYCIMIEISVNNLAYSTNRYVAIIFLIPICDSENWNLHDNVLLSCCII